MTMCIPRHPEAALAAEGSLGSEAPSCRPRLDELREGVRAVAHRMLLRRVHLAEGDRVALWHEDGIVAEALLPARRSDERARDRALEHLAGAVGPGERQRRHERRA